MQCYASDTGRMCHYILNTVDVVTRCVGLDSQFHPTPEGVINYLTRTTFSILDIQVLLKPTHKLR